MANSAGSKKRARQAIVRRGRNASQRSMTRSYVKKVIAAIEANDYEKATAELLRTQPVLDSMGRKGIISPNKASRTMSLLSSRVKALKAA